MIQAPAFLIFCMTTEIVAKLPHTIGEQRHVEKEPRNKNVLPRKQQNDLEPSDEQERS